MAGRCLHHTLCIAVLRDVRIHTAINEMIFEIRFGTRDLELYSRAPRRSEMVKKWNFCFQAEIEKHMTSHEKKIVLGHFGPSYPS